MSISRFRVHPLGKYRLPCPLFSEPKEILSFSYSEHRKQCMDNRELKYYYAPQLDPAPCLFDGFEAQIQRDHMVNEHIDSLLTSLCYAQKQAADPRLLQSDFVMFRGMLTRMFVTPYSMRESWAMNATKFGSTIYIEDDLPPEKLAERGDMTDHHRKLAYSGYRFESLCMINEPPARLSPEKLNEELQNRQNSVVNTNTEYCTVFRTRLGPHSIISGAEIDCIDGEKPAEFPTRRYHELKTAYVLDTERKVETFERYKLLKFWAQSFISGTPVVTVGFRDADGMLRRVEDIRTEDMPRIVRGKQGMWTPNVCMNFANVLLEFINTNVVEPGPEFQYRISYEAEDQSIQIMPLGKCKPFLTEEFISEFSGK
ncbi:decapping endonuclease targeting mRNA [Coemansia sp. RSA 1933]|nr:decapping endonuclease targeting mRNA [Coemansia sp. RSA 1933]